MLAYQKTIVIDLKRDASGEICHRKSRNALVVCLGRFGFRDSKHIERPISRITVGNCHWQVSHRLTAFSVQNVYLHRVECRLTKTQPFDNGMSAKTRIERARLFTDTRLITEIRLGFNPVAQRAIDGLLFSGCFEKAAA
jgi:hypothetical protein